MFGFTQVESGTPVLPSPSELIDGNLHGFDLRDLEAATVDRFIEKVRFLQVAGINQRQVNDGIPQGESEISESFVEDYKKILESPALLEFIETPLLNGVRVVAEGLDSLERRLYEHLPELAEWIISVQGSGSKQGVMNLCNDAIEGGIPKSFMPTIDVINVADLKNYSTEEILFTTEEMPPGMDSNDSGLMTVVVSAHSNQRLYNQIVGEIVSRDLNVYALSNYLSEENPSLSAGRLLDIFQLISRVYPSKQYRNEVWDGLIERCGYEVLFGLSEVLCVIQKNLLSLITYEMMKVDGKHYLLENPEATPGDLVANMERFARRDISKNIIGTAWGNRATYLQFYMQTKFQL